MGLTRKVNNIRVMSIRYQGKVEEITDFAVFENNENLVNILSALFVGS